MISGADIYTDFQGLAQLKAAAGHDATSPATLRKVAEQFEALFTQMVLKSMRDANAGFGNEQMGGEDGKFYQDIYDQQISLLLAKGRHLGLADMLVRQLGGKPAAQEGKTGTPETSDESMPGDPMEVGGASAFVKKIWPYAQAAARKLGVPPQALVSQAALETGWGRSVIRRTDGSSSYNLFNIKADGRWQGDTANASTLEYSNGTAARTRQTFRAYSSYGEAFDDYVKFLQSNPRYRDVLDGTGNAKDFARGLAQAGYATDPAYAQKMEGILNGQPLREALADLKSDGERPLTA